MGPGKRSGKKLNFAQKSCVGKTGKLMMETGMLHKGARIGVAVSGGVDSMVLLRVLRLRRDILPFEIEIMALHINPGFDPANHAPLIPFAEELGVSAHIETTRHGPRAHSSENRKKSPCFYCALLRRKRLFDLCAGYGLTHLAFGHNADDLAATFFMNLLAGGKVAGLSARESFFGGALTVIRPMLMIEKNLVRRAAGAWELPVWENPCPSSKTSKRVETAAVVEELCRGDRRTRANLYGALKRWQLDRDTAKF